MTDFSPASFRFPAVRRKPVTAAFDGGRLTSDGGVMLLAMAERRLGIADRLAACFPDRRDPMRVRHSLGDMIRPHPGDRLVVTKIATTWISCASIRAIRN